MTSCTMTLAMELHATYREQAQALFKRAEEFERRSSRRFDSAPGSLVTGSSGRRRSGLDKKWVKAVDGSFADLEKAKKLRARAGVNCFTLPILTTR